MLDKSGIYPGYIGDISRIQILNTSKIYLKYIWDIFSDLSGIPRLRVSKTDTTKIEQTKTIRGHGSTSVHLYIQMFDSKNSSSRYCARVNYIRHNDLFTITSVVASYG